MQLARAAAGPREQPGGHADRGADRDVHDPGLGQVPVGRCHLGEDERDHDREQRLCPPEAEQRAGGEPDDHHHRQHDHVEGGWDADDEQRGGRQRADHRAEQRRPQRRAGLGRGGAHQGEDREQHPEAVREVEHPGQQPGRGERDRQPQRALEVRPSAASGARAGGATTAAGPARCGEPERSRLGGRRRVPSVCNRRPRDHADRGHQRLRPLAEAQRERAEPQPLRWDAVGRRGLPGGPELRPARRRSRSVSGTGAAALRSQSAAASAQDAVWCSSAAAAGRVERVAVVGVVAGRRCARAAAGRSPPRRSTPGRAAPPRPAAAVGGSRDGRSASAASVAAGSSAASRSGRPRAAPAVGDRVEAAGEARRRRVPSLRVYGTGVGSGQSDQLGPGQQQHRQGQPGEPPARATRVVRREARQDVEQLDARGEPDQPRAAHAAKLITKPSTSMPAVAAARAHRQQRAERDEQPADRQHGQQGAGPLRAGCPGSARAPRGRPRRTARTAPSRRCPARSGRRRTRAQATSVTRTARRTTSSPGSRRTSQPGAVTPASCHGALTPASGKPQVERKALHVHHR